MISYRTTTKCKLATHQRRQLMSLSHRGHDYIREDYQNFREGRDKILLALDSGSVVGWAMLRENRCRTYFYVFVRQSYRQRGLGSGLFRLACRRADHPTLVVYPHNGPSRAFYKRMEGVAHGFRKKVQKINAEA